MVVADIYTSAATRLKLAQALVIEPHQLLTVPGHRESASAMPEPLEVLDQPLARGITFELRASELERITTHGTATEIASIEYGHGGDTIEQPPEPETMPVEGATP